MVTHIMGQNQIEARAHFASLNGWKVGKSFDLILLMNNKAHDGGVRGCRIEFEQFGGYHTDGCDHAEYFRIGGKPMAIVGHNYPGQIEATRKGIAEIFKGRLKLHEPEAGMGVSWYYPFGALPMCITRPDIEHVRWPSYEDCARYALTYHENARAEYEASEFWSRQRKERDSLSLISKR